MSLRDVVRLIRGKKGSTVRLTVLRQGAETERFNVTIMRDTVDLKEQAANLRWETRTVDGRIYQRPFGGHTTEFGDGPAVQRTCAAADRTGHAILHTLYGQSLKHKAEF